MANAMLSGTSRAHTARLLGRSPSACLKAPSSSPLLCGPQWLFSAHSIFATSSTPQPPGLSKVRDTWKKVLGNKCKDHSALGEPAVS